MNYNLMICSADKCWIAIDVNDDGKYDRISFDGNESMKIVSIDNVKVFCSHILSYYNIDEFEEIELNIKIVLVSEYSNLIEELFMQMHGAKKLNVIDVKNLIPIFVLKNYNVKPGSVVNVECIEKKFTLQINENLDVSYVTDNARETMLLEPEWLTILFRFNCNNLVSNETELRDLESKYLNDLKKKEEEISIQRKQYHELKNKYEELEKNYIQFQKEVEESRSKFDEKREVYFFAKDQLTMNQYKNCSGIADAICDFSNGASASLKGLKLRYSCKLLKTEGAIVKKGTALIEIIVSQSGLGVCITKNDKCFIKARSDGRVFYLVSDGEEVKNNEPVMLLSDEADTKEDVMKWYKKMT